MMTTMLIHPFQKKKKTETKEETSLKEQGHCDRKKNYLFLQQKKIKRLKNFVVEELNCLSYSIVQVHTQVAIYCCVALLPILETRK